jgi:hypothetical protein
VERSPPRRPAWLCLGGAALPNGARSVLEPAFRSPTQRGLPVHASDRPRRFGCEGYPLSEQLRRGSKRARARARTSTTRHCSGWSARTNTCRWRCRATWATPPRRRTPSAFSCPATFASATCSRTFRHPSSASPRQATPSSSGRAAPSSRRRRRADAGRRPLSRFRSSPSNLVVSSHLVALMRFAESGVNAGEVPGESNGAPEGY